MFFDEVANIFNDVTDRDNLRVSCFVLGGNKVHIEGISKIASIDDTSITVMLKKGHINISGEGLKIVRSERDNLSIGGKIKSINFE
ncbi:MAG: YabP/YqfC family sporulation protein [Firmicutes bacterium]|nr:YabP/YqfC family sporulation protein [Bacillota bacterium]